MDLDRPITRREFQEEIAEFRQEFKAELTAELTVVMRDIETNLLTAFHSYAKGNAARLGGLEVTDRELRARMDALESRVLALETRRPPAA